MYINEITVGGRLCQDPTFTKGNTPEKDRVWGRLAVMGEHTDFVPFVAWGQQARHIANYCTKGKMMVVTGQLRTATKQRPDATYDNYYEVNARQVTFGPDAKKVPELHEKMQKRVGHPKPSALPGIGHRTSGWTMKSAYEANKKAEKCVVCGKELNFHPSVAVKYCSCVDKLPK